MKKLNVIAAAVAASFTGIAAAEPHSQIKADWFEFVVPTLSTDRTAASPIDLSYLSPDPAGTDGHLRADGDDIVDGDGDRVVLFGTNICDWHAMPPVEHARPIAQRLKQLGVNFVRLHYYDYAPSPEGMMRPDMKTVDPEKLDEFHRLIAELADAGIYTDVNLHVARVYPTTPAGFYMGKGVDRILPRLIEDQKSFARQVLTPPNPHRDGMPLAEDPAVAIVEINNENSLMRDFWTLVAGLSEEQAPGLRGRWNDYLREKYGDTDGLAAAWNDDLPPESGDDLLGGVAALGGEASGGGESTVTRDGDRLKWTIIKAGNEVWNHQLLAGDVPLDDGDQAVLRLRYRGTEDLGVRVMKDGGSWSSVTAAVRLPASQDWQDYAISWTVGDSEPEVTNRLSFDAFNETGTYEIADLSLRRGALPGVTGEQSLEDDTVPLPGLGGNGRAVADWRDFCEQVELDYTDNMRRFLKDELGVKSMVFDTQASYGGGIGIVREMRHDLIDTHDYPTHPVATEVDGERAFRVEQKSVIGDAFYSLSSRARWNVEGMPSGVSEYDVNPPQDYNSESYPLLALMSAYQGIDMIGEYAWLNFQPTYTPDTLAHPYHTSGNPAQIAFIPAAAMMMRGGTIEPAGDPVTLVAREETLMDGDLGWSPLDADWRRLGVDYSVAWRQAVRLRVEPGEGPATLEGSVRGTGERSIFESDTGQIRLDRTTEGGETLAVDAPAIKMAFGHTLDKTFELGDVTMTITEAGTQSGDYANVALVALDGKPIAESERMLLASVARVHGQGWRFLDEDDTTVMLGDGPTMAEPTGVTLTLPGGPWTLTPLDGSGNPAGEPVTGSEFDTRGLQSLWFLIEPKELK